MIKEVDMQRRCARVRVLLARQGQFGSKGKKEKKKRKKKGHVKKMKFLHGYNLFFLGGRVLSAKHGKHSELHRILLDVLFTFSSICHLFCYLPTYYKSP